MLGEIKIWLHIEEHFDAEQTDLKTQIYLVSYSEIIFTFYGKLATCKTYFSFYCFNRPFKILAIFKI